MSDDVSLGDYATKTNGFREPETLQEWLQSNPNVIDEILRGRGQGITWTTVANWLKKVHGRTATSTNLARVIAAVTEEQE